MLFQSVQLVGSLLVLGAFVASQLGRLRPQSLSYLVPNAIGSAVLAVLAALSVNVGFLLLEGVWACVSTWGVVQAVRRSHAEQSAGVLA